MTDIDYCSGGRCPMKETCRRFADYKARLAKGDDVRFNMTPPPGAEKPKDPSCPHYLAKEFYGN